MDIPAILSWKFHNAEGITFKAGELIEWPDSLGPRPTLTQILTWAGEYQTYVNDIAAKEQALIQAKLDATAENLPAWAQVKTAIQNSFPDLGQRRIILGIARLVYLMAKNQVD